MNNMYPKSRAALAETPNADWCIAITPAIVNGVRTDGYGIALAIDGCIYDDDGAVMCEAYHRVQQIKASCGPHPAAVVAARAAAKTLGLNKIIGE